MPDALTCRPRTQHNQLSEDRERDIRQRLLKSEPKRAIARTVGASISTVRSIARCMGFMPPKQSRLRRNLDRDLPPRFDPNNPAQMCPRCHRVSHLTPAGVCMGCEDRRQIAIQRFAGEETP